jgi:hypothetical protein
MTGDNIKADVQAVLDDAGIQWADANLLTWINAGGRDIASYKPKATTLRAAITLTSGVSKQALPAGAIAVLDLTVNLGTSGTSIGRAITPVSEERLRAVRPGWRADTGAAVKHLVQDDRDAGFFTVWPAPNAALQVEALLHKHYTPIAALGDTLTLDDSYRNALGEFVLHMAYAMEGDSMSAELSAAHYAKYAQTIGIQVQRQKRASSAANSTENPAYPAVDKNGA